MQLRYGKLMVSAIAALAVAGAYAQWTITIDQNSGIVFGATTGTLRIQPRLCCPLPARSPKCMSFP